MVFFEKGKWFWLEHEKEAYLPVELKKQKGNVIIAKSHSGEQFEIPADQDLAEVNETSLTHVANMVEMEELSEAAILHNLRQRYEEDLIYTYISSILVSCNPYKMLPIYSPAVMKDYRQKLAAHQKCDPHVYALADGAYKALTLNNKDQAVIISGESGAGKTEATKLVLQYMAEMSGQGAEVEQQLLETNPIIEAFGNAKTARNDNSSRFGKWVEIVFDEKYHIIGARIENYLLEKSRIVQPGPTERNYHIFYQLCSGANKEQKKKWSLSHPSNFRILSAGDTFEVDGMDDVSWFKSIQKAMKAFHFQSDESEGLLATCAAIMHLGNVEFDAKGDKASVKDSSSLEKAANLLAVDVEQLGQALVSQKKKMGRDFITTFRNQTQAEAGRDACCKALYSKMFDWLIVRINKALAVKKTKNCHVVGVLDIFGFEIFETNRFEQFCINFANEKMQQHFNEHIFTMEQNEYKADKIDVDHVEFVDNQPCLDVIEGGKGSILGMTDEELKVPRGSDDNLLGKMHNKWGKNKYYCKPKMQKPQFGIMHYAGQVDYQIEQFMQKNKDALDVDIAEAIRSSKAGFVSNLIQASTKQTVGGQFRSQLGSLMKTLKATEPHFIRCIKPNPIKARDTFDAQMSLRQLRYLGLKEVVNIRQLGYPIRRSHADFWARYKMVAADELRFNKKLKPNKACKQLLKSMAGDINPDDWRIGDTKVFLRNSVQVHLETKREAMITEMVVALQAMARAKMWRARFLQYKTAKARLTAACKGKSVEELDESLEAFQALGFTSDPKLVQKAVKAKNAMIKMAKAIAALKNSLASKDEQLIEAALKAAKKAKMDTNAPEYVEAKKLHKTLKKYNENYAAATAKKDAKLIKACIAESKKIGLNTDRERDMVELLAAVEEGDKMKARLAKAMKSKDLASLKKMLELAKSSGSGAMMDSALKRALEAGLADDPVVKAAMAMEKTLEKEIKTKSGMQAELTNAINSRDYDYLKKTMEMAEKKKMTKLKQYKEAKKLVDVVKKEKMLLDDLQQAMDTKDTDMMTATIMACQMSGLKDNEVVLEAQKLVAILDQEGDNMDEGKKAEKKAKAQESALALLKSAMAAADADMLRSALKRANAAGLSQDPIYKEAEAMQADAERQDDLMAQEEDQAEAAVEGNEDVGDKRGPSHKVRKEIKSMSTGGAYVVPEVQYDENDYTDDANKLARFSMLRSGQDFASKSFLKKKKVMAGMLHHSKSQLPRSLTRLDKRPEAQALEMFKSVQGFMGDRQYSFPDALASELVQTVTFTPDLRDELFCQIIKQVVRNPDVNTTTKGWQLLCLVLETLIPSDHFVAHLLYFLHKNMKSEEPFSPFANYAFKMLVRTAARFEQLGDPKTRPTPNFKPGQKVVPQLAIEHVTVFRARTMVGNYVDVTFPDNSEIKLFVEPWDICEHLVHRVAEEIKLTDVEHCALFAVSGHATNFLFPRENVLDVQHSWKQQASKEKKKKKGKFTLRRRKKQVEADTDDGTRRIVFKRRVHAKPIGDSKCVVNRRLMFHQTQREVAMGLHNVSQESAVNLAATYQCIMDSETVPLIGQPGERIKPDSYDSVNMVAAPLNLVEGKKKLTQKKMDKKVEKAKEDPAVAKATLETYMTMAKQLPSFGAQFYNVKQTYDKSYPPDLLVCINVYGVSLLDRATWKEVAFHPFMSVLGWSSNPSLVLLKVKLEKGQSKSGKTSIVLRLLTDKPRVGKEVCDILMAYANEMMKAMRANAKPPPPKKK